MEFIEQQRAQFLPSLSAMFIYARAPRFHGFIDQKAFVVLCLVRFLPLNSARPERTQFVKLHAFGK